MERGGVADKTERQEIDRFPGLNSFSAQRDWFAAKLVNRSREECILLAGRAALRTLPMLHSMLDDFPDQKARNALTDTIFPLLRCSVVTVIASLSSATDKDLYRSAAMTAVADVAAPDSAAELSIYHAAKSASIEQSMNASAEAAMFAAASYGVGPSFGYGTAFIYDLDLLNNQPLRVVACEPLWPSIALENARWEHELRLGTWRRTDPDFFLREWSTFSTILRKAGDDWDVWADWFDGVYQGRKGAVYLFGLPTERALKLWQDVALIDDDTWRAGPAVLNAEFKRLVAVAKKEVADSRLTPTSAAKLETLGTNKPRGTKGTASKTFAPKTATGKAIFANAGSLALHTYSLVSILDSEVERIKESRPNSDDAINERDQLINKFKDIRSDVLGFQATLIAFAASEVPEKEVIKKADSVLKPFRDCWNEKGKEFIEVASRSGLFLGAMAIALYCGVPPLAGTLVIGAISSGKPLVEVLKAAKGIFKLT